MGTAQCRSSPRSKIVLSREFRCTGRLVVRRWCQLTFSGADAHAVVDAIGTFCWFCHWRDTGSGINLPVPLHCERFVAPMKKALPHPPTPLAVAGQVQVATWFRLGITARCRSHPSSARICASLAGGFFQR
jgi:hypothetical protein